MPRERARTFPSWMAGLLLPPLACPPRPAPSSGGCSRAWWSSTPGVECPGGLALAQHWLLSSQPKEKLILLWKLYFKIKYILWYFSQWKPYVNGYLFSVPLYSPRREWAPGPWSSLRWSTGSCTSTPSVELLALDPCKNVGCTVSNMYVQNMCRVFTIVK